MNITLLRLGKGLTASLLIAILALKLDPAQAQETGAYPVIQAEVYRHPIREAVSARILTTRDGMEHEVYGGSFYVDYELTCQNGICPAESPRTINRRRATVPCGISESGPIVYYLANLGDFKRPYPEKTTFTLKITNIRFHRWDDSFIDNVNQRYGYDSRKYKPGGTFETVRNDPCKKGTYTGDGAERRSDSKTMNLY